MRLTLFLLLISIFAGLLFFFRSGFRDTIQHYAETALKREGCQMQIEHLSFNPFRGFIAKNVSLNFANHNKLQLSAHAKYLTFSLSIGQLLLGRIFVNEIRLNSVSLEISLSDTEEKAMSIQNVNATVLLWPDHLRLSIAEFTFENIHFLVSSSFRNPYLLQKAANTVEKKKLNLEMVKHIAKELGKIQYLDKSACADIILESDLSTGTLQANKITFHARNIQYCSVFLRELELGARYTNGILEVYRLYMKDAEGTLEGTGSANFLISKGQFAVSSSMNLQPFLKGLLSQSRLQRLSMQKFRTGSSSQVDLITHLSWKGDNFQYRVFGSAAIHKCSYGESCLRHLELSFFADNRQWFIRNLLVQSHSGMLHADIVWAKAHLQIRLNSTLNPKDIADFFDPKMRAFLDHMQFLDPPRIMIQLNGPKLNCLSGQGELSLGRTAMRGAWMDFGHSKLKIIPQSVSCRNFTIRCKDGIGSGTITYFFGKKQVRLHKIISTLSPQDIMLWIGPHLAKIVAPYRFHSSPIIQAEGLVHLTNPNLNTLLVHIRSPSGLDYDLFKRALPFGPTRATIYMKGPEIKVQIPSAVLFQGSVALQANIFLHTSQPTFELSIFLSHIAFERLTNLFFGYTKSNGFLTGNYHFLAQAGKDSMQGEGYICVEEGSVLSIPFLGPLSLILNQLIPGVGYEPAQKACTAFQVRNQKVSTNNLQVAGLGFSLLGYGDIDFCTGKMSMTVRVNVPGVTGIVLFPVSKLLEFESKGTLSKPNWQLKRLKPFIQF